jgi:hypothetical protein
VKLVSEGRDADMDRVMQSHTDTGKDDTSKAVSDPRKTDANENHHEGSTQKEKEAM